MKTLINLHIILFILIIQTFSFATTVKIDGFVYLENQNNHKGIEVVFTRTVPSKLNDTVFTDEKGYYITEIEEGIYDINFSNSNYKKKILHDNILYENKTLQNVYLKFTGLSGKISGVLEKGIYVVGGNLEIASNDSLLIKPGTTLLFMEDVEFNIYGLLKAEGTEKDSIIFTKYDDTTSWGGVIFKSSASDNCVLKYCKIEYAKHVGLEICNDSPFFSNVEVSNNGLDYEGYYGGGIQFFGSNARLSNFKVCHNNIGYINNMINGGGIILSMGSKPIIENSIICDNDAGFGGGIYVMDSYLTLNNVIISNNKAIDGGGIHIFTGRMKLTNVTIVNNTAEVGGGISRGGSLNNITNSIIAFNKGYGVEGSELSNCCVFGNEPGDFRNAGKWYGIKVKTNKNGDSCDAYNNIMENPRFIDFENRDYHLLENSPCIDIGINDSVTTLADYDGNIRIWDGNNDGNATVDLGVYEFKAPPVSKIDTILNNDFEKGLMAWEVDNENNTTWSIVSDKNIAHNSKKCLKLTPTNNGGNLFLKSPQIFLPKNKSSIISLWCKKSDEIEVKNNLNNLKIASNNPVEIKLKISESGNDISDFVVTQKNVQISEKDWVKIEFDISKFAGRKIYLAFDCNFFDLSSLYIDDIYINSKGGIDKVSDYYFNNKQMSYCYPNPFTETAKIYYSVEKPSFVKLVIYEINGNKVLDIINGFFSAGDYYQVINSRELTPGIYFYYLQIGEESEIGKIIINK